jgi:3-isopropylmalate dehydrogenase
MAAVLTLALLLEDLEVREAAEAVEEAVRRALQEGVTTADLGGRSSTSEVGDFLAEVTGGS